jgi:drug/metabolite transporter (DMT)-like permease
VFAVAAVACIIAGTVLVSLGNKSKAGAASSMLGLAFIIASLACDGVTGGVQKRLKGQLLTSRAFCICCIYDWMYCSQ